VARRGDAAADVTEAGSAGGDGNLVLVRESQEGADHLRGGGEDDGIGRRAREPFIPAMGGERGGVVPHGLGADDGREALAQ